VPECSECGREMFSMGEEDYYCPKCTEFTLADGRGVTNVSFADLWEASTKMPFEDLVDACQTVVDEPTPIKDWKIGGIYNPETGELEPWEEK